jgi:TatD DNase family protein
VIDTHAHLGEDAAEVLARARLAGVDRVVVVATTVAGARAALTLAEAETGVYASLGIHPHEAGSATRADVDELRALLGHPKAVAVGETGLDHFRDYAPRDAQRWLFEAQLELGAETGKPVVIHTRAADDDTLELLSAHEGAVVLHCFSSPPLLAEASSRGWYVSFAGNVTYKNAYELRAAARAVPDGLLLAETDSPYLAPQPVRGRRNEPAFVVHTYSALAEARGVELAPLVAQIDANAEAVFGL